MLRFCSVFSETNSVSKISFPVLFVGWHSITLHNVEIWLGVSRCSFGSKLSGSSPQHRTGYGSKAATGECACHTQILGARGIVHIFAKNLHPPPVYLQCYWIDPSENLGCNLVWSVSRSDRLHALTNDGTV